ncbi:MFS transporter [Egibacter rhizosphaerae]|uniref:MFS transporter n=1 Tax=Egibacter rhizosphaerae TaxID=1670831 RepID=A0A411YEA1_9ACTN|nr:MFS transporter [Egibacter rhizosphaerae]QBI19539.1 MFS transporter [Egibacter rhizosphaerae]
MRELVAAGAGLIAVTYGLARFALGLFVPELQAAFDVTATVIGVVMGASFAGYLTALLAVGRLVGRLGARTVAVGGGLAAVAGTAGVAAAPVAVALGVAAFVGGASTGLASPALASAVEHRLAVAVRPAAQTVINAGTSLGLIAAVPVALTVAAAWRTAWWVFAGVALLATASVAVALRAPSRAPRPDRGAARSPATDPAASRHTGAGGAGRAGTGSTALDDPFVPVTAGTAHRHVLSPALVAAAALLGVASAAFWSFGREALETLGSLSPLVGRTAWMAAGVGGLAGAGAGSLSVRYGLRTALLIGWTPLAASLAWLGSGPSSPVPAYAAAGAFGAGYMVLTGLLIVWSVRDRPDRPATAVAAAFAILAIGQSAGAPLAGALTDQAGLAWAFAVATFAALGGALALPSRAKRRDSPSEPAPRLPAAREEGEGDDR